MVVSAGQEISNLPSEENAIEFTVSEWPLSVREVTLLEHLTVSLSSLLTTS